MKLNTKLSLAALSLLGAATVGMISIEKKTVLKATSDLFEMVDGASLKLNEDGGLRFRVKMSSDVRDIIVNNDNVTMGFIVAPYELFSRVNDGNYIGMSQKVQIDVDENLIYLEDGYYYANGCLTNIKEANRMLDFSPLAYIKTVDGDTTYRYANIDGNEISNSGLESLKRNFYSVTNSAILYDGEDYLTPILDTYDAYKNWFGTASYPIVVDTVAKYNQLVAKINSDENGLLSSMFVDVSSSVAALIEANDPSIDELDSGKNLPSNIYSVEDTTTLLSSEFEHLVYLNMISNNDVNTLINGAQSGKVCDGNTLFSLINTVTSRMGNGSNALEKLLGNNIVSSFNEQAISSFLSDHSNGLDGALANNILEKLLEYANDANDPLSNLTSLSSSMIETVFKGQQTKIDELKQELAGVNNNVGYEDVQDIIEYYVHNYINDSLIGVDNVTALFNTTIVGNVGVWSPVYNENADVLAANVASLLNAINTYITGNTYLDYVYLNENGLIPDEDLYTFLIGRKVAVPNDVFTNFLVKVAKMSDSEATAENCVSTMISMGLMSKRTSWDPIIENQEGATVTTNLVSILRKIRTYHESLAPAESGLSNEILDYFASAHHGSTATIYGNSAYTKDQIAEIAAPGGTYASASSLRNNFVRAFRMYTGGGHTAGQIVTLINNGTMSYSGHTFAWEDENLKTKAKQFMNSESITLTGEEIKAIFETIYNNIVASDA